MGSICWITAEPENWKAYNSGKRLKDEYGGENLLKVCYGVLDDERIYDMEMYMRKSVYEKVLNGEYKVSPNSKWQRKLILVDKTGCEISPLCESCY